MSRGKAWTPRESRALLDAHRAGLDDEQLVEAVSKHGSGRSLSAIKAQLRSLGFPRSRTSGTGGGPLPGTRVKVGTATEAEAREPAMRITQEQHERHLRAMLAEVQARAA